MATRDGHVRILPPHVANKIAAGEVVERPAAVVKELMENSLDAGAANIAVAVEQGGRKLVSVRDDGCGMAKEDALLCLERQATSKILDVEDIERIDTLGFRGEAIPSIASVSRFSLTTRRKESDEGVFLQVNAGALVETRSAGSPPGTLVEARDLFCNVPARKKFLRSCATEESHVRGVFMRLAMAHPRVGFSLVSDGRQVHALAPAKDEEERIRDILGREQADSLAPMEGACGLVKVHGFIERPSFLSPMRHEQYIFVNGRPASSPSIAYAIREAYPRKQGDAKPAAVIFIVLPPDQVDVNVHPAKREVRFRDNTSVKNAIAKAIESALAPAAAHAATDPPPMPHVANTQPQSAAYAPPAPSPAWPQPVQPTELPAMPTPMPVPAELPIAAEDETNPKPWQWFRFLAITDSGYLMLETDAGIVTVNPHAARERIAFERLLGENGASQQLLIPEMVRLSPLDAARLSASLDTVRGLGFQIEEFGPCTFKIDAVPQIIGSLAAPDVLSTVARDLSESHGDRGAKWREERIARSIARSFAGSEMNMTAESATALVEELCTCRTPYVCPRGKPVMIFTSNRELDRRFGRA